MNWYKLGAYGWPVLAAAMVALFFHVAFAQVDMAPMGADAGIAIGLVIWYAFFHKVKP